MSTRLKRTNSQSWQSKLPIRRVLITDKVAKVMVDMLKEGGLEVTEVVPKDVAQLKELVKGYDALLVRSSTQVTAEVIEATEGLKLIGRAGTGVDNIDVVAATQKGILVMNTPGANTISAAEHTVALLMATARNIQQAAISFKVQHKWDRSKLTGIELQGKTLGVLGLGRIGREVAFRMKAFGMRIVGYDPVIPPEAVAKFGITSLPFEEVLKIADVLTVHTPLVEGTRGLLGHATFPLCKRGVIVVNCARGGIVDEEALVVALNSGIVAGAGLDVFVDEPPVDIPNNPLINHPKVTATPHLGASTEEAQDKVARELATQIIDLVNGKGFDGIINAPALSCSANSAAHPWLSCGYRIGSIIGQLILNRFKGQAAGALKSLSVESRGPDVKQFTDGLLAATAAGVLNEFNNEKVNMVNALTVAQDNQLKLSSTHDENAEIYKNEIEIRYTVGDHTHTYKATVFHDTARIVQIDQYYVELEPSGIILFLRNFDRPGVAAFVGRHFADDNVNISSLSIGRSMIGKALTIVCLDNEPSPGVVERIISHENIENGVLVHVQEP